MIICFCKRTLQNDSIKSPDVESNTSKGSSLGGSPLKLTEYFVARDTVSSCKTGATYKPCTINEARYGFKESTVNYNLPPGLTDTLSIN